MSRIVLRRLPSAALVLLLLAASPAAAAEGEDLFLGTCAACHQEGGEGVPGVYPPLADRIGRFVRVPEGRRYLARVVMHGLFGPIEVEDRAYAGLMPPLPQLGDDEVAAVLNYTLTELSPEQLPAGFEPLSAEEVAGYREPEAGPSAMVREREALLEALEQRGAATGGIPRIHGVAQDYARWCQGCHRADGLGAPDAVPRLRDFAGYLTRTPEGRAYLARVPGVASAPLDDRRLADVLNWTLSTFSRDQLTPDFRPYTAREVARARSDPLPNAKSARARLIDELQAAGIVPPHQDGLERLRAGAGP